MIPANTGRNSDRVSGSQATGDDPHGLLEGNVELTCTCVRTATPCWGSVFCSAEY